MSDDDTITLNVQWLDGDTDITGDPCARSNASGVRLWTPGGECVAEWTRAESGDRHVWNVSGSDYTLYAEDNEALSGFAQPGRAVVAGVAWFRTHCQVRSTITTTLL
jgi:hypothetical protein